MTTGKEASRSIDLMVIDEVPVPPGLGRESLLPLVTHVLASERAVGRWAICVVFTSDEALQRLHAQFMGLDSPTDIMTFPYAVEDGFASPEEDLGGDIVISVDRAREQAGEAGWPLDSELRFLVAHGLLHLLGWDDHSPADRRAMLTRQRELLSGARG